jgi:hypothetical protein
VTARQEVGGDRRLHVAQAAVRPPQRPPGGLQAPRGQGLPRALHVGSRRGEVAEAVICGDRPRRAGARPGRSPRSVAASAARGGARPLRRARPAPRCAPSTRRPSLPPLPRRVAGRSGDSGVPDPGHHWNQWVARVVQVGDWGVVATPGP